MTLRRITFHFLLLIAFALVSSASMLAQKSIDWYDLEEVSFGQSDPSHKGPVYGEPHFPQTLKDLEGKTLRIQGYMLPLTVDNQLYVLSRYPFTECFFCGGAGKETVIHLEPKESDLSFELDESVIVTGIFRLVDDPQELCFKIEKARIDPE